MGSFKNINTNEVVKVLSEDNNFFILDSGQRVDKQLFVQKYISCDVDPVPVVENTQNTQVINTMTQTQTQPHNSEIDVNSFFAAKPNIDGLDNINSFDTKNMVDMPKKVGRDLSNVVIRDTDVDMPGVRETPTLSLEERKRIALDEYNATQRNQQNNTNNGYGSTQVDVNDETAVNNLINSQIKPVEKQVKQLNENGLTEQQEFLRQQQIEANGIDPYKDKIEQYRLSHTKTAPVNQSNNTINNNVNDVDNNINNQHINDNGGDDEVIKIFKKIKRNHKISIKLNISDKIGKPDFIQLMADNLDGDIIQYYTDEIYKMFVSDISIIKENIYKQIYKKVYDVDFEGYNKNIEIDDVEEIKENTLVDLIPGNKTKGGKQKYKFITNTGKLVELLIETAQKKQYRPATKNDLKKK